MLLEAVDVCVLLFVVACARSVWRRERRPCMQRQTTNMLGLLALFVVQLTFVGKTQKVETDDATQPFLTTQPCLGRSDFVVCYVMYLSTM